jgi:hypothetical protein
MGRYFLFFILGFLTFGIGVSIALYFYQNIETSDVKLSKEHTNSAKQEPLTVPKQVLNLIVSGESIGNITLGMTQDEVVQILGKKKFYIFNYDTNENCPDTEINVGDENQNLDRDRVKNGLRIFIKRNKVSQIKVESFLYSTKESITSDGSIKSVFDAYPNAKPYMLLNSSSDLTGPKDLVYLVDKNNGIAFEFYYDRREKNRRAGFIFVFQKGDSFEPDGCLMYPKQFIPLKSL